MATFEPAQTQHHEALQLALSLVGPVMVGAAYVRARKAAANTPSQPPPKPAPPVAR
ncbi:MAG: hypothetical protein AB2A00_38910 [Myxococcota bacterium]